MSEIVCKESPSQEEEIRLLHLLPGARNDGIACTLATVSLASKPQYTVLSYTWGASRENKTIRLDEVDGFPVTDNLEAALRRLRHHDAEQILWVDAICINQNDLRERGKQISHMSLIYVLEWLGNQSHEVFDGANFPSDGLAMKKPQELPLMYNVRTVRAEQHCCHNIDTCECHTNQAYGEDCGGSDMMWPDETQPCFPPLDRRLLSSWRIPHSLVPGSYPEMSSQQSPPSAPRCGPRLSVSEVQREARSDGKILTCGFGDCKAEFSRQYEMIRHQKGWHSGSHRKGYPCIFKGHPERFLGSGSYAGAGHVATKFMAVWCTPPLSLIVAKYVSQHGAAEHEMGRLLGFDHLNNLSWLPASPLAFLYSLVGSAMLMRSLAYLNRADQFQNWFLLASVPTWIALSLALGLDLLTGSLCILPWVVYTCLLLSDVTHRVLRAREADAA